MRRGEVVPEEIAERAGSRVRLNTRAGADVCTADVTTSRLDRRKARTRPSLVAAARTLLASRDPAEISIQEITDAADVGFGSFYNHFRSKQDLFDAAVEEVLEEHGDMVDAVTASIVDPAEVFAAAIRMTARLPKTQPQIAKIFRRIGFDLLAAPRGLAPRARRGPADSGGGRPVHRRRPGRGARLRCRRPAGRVAGGVDRHRARRRRPGGGRAGGEPAAYVRRFG